MAKKFLDNYKPANSPLVDKARVNIFLDGMFSFFSFSETAVVVG